MGKNGKILSKNPQNKRKKAKNTGKKAIFVPYGGDA